MARSNKKLLIIGGLGVAALAIYWLTRKSSPATALSPAPGGPVSNTGVTPTNPTQSLLSEAEQLLLGLLKKAPTAATTYPPLASTTTAATSPASQIPYINPTAPAIPITVDTQNDPFSELGLTFS